LIDAVWLQAENLDVVLPCGGAGGGVAGDGGVKTQGFCRSAASARLLSPEGAPVRIEKEGDHSSRHRVIAPRAALLQIFDAGSLAEGLL